MKIDGKCHCGDLTYTATLETPTFTVCHCNACQEMSGTAYRANARVATDAFEMTGEPAIYERTAGSGRKRIHAFCRRCGTNIYSTGTGEHGKELSLRTGTIRQRGELRPARQTWFECAQEWTQALSGLPTFERGAG